MRIMFAVVFGLIALSSVNGQSWSPAGPGDKRSPCPALNTLANYGYINHNGADIVGTDLINALMNVYNLDNPLASKLVNDAIADLGYTDANGNKALDLDTLSTHNHIEHDASLTRRDYGDGDNHTPQADLIEQLKGMSADGETLGWTEMAKARNLRASQESAVDPSYGLDLKHKALALGEASLVLRILGTGDSMPVDWIDTWFANESIPEDWTKPALPYTLIQAGLDVAKLGALTLINLE
jgi:hypothetical protein